MHIRSVLAIVASLPAVALTCVVPTGIGAGQLINFDDLFLPAGRGDPLGVFGNAIVAGALGALAVYETPVQARLVLSIVTPIYNAAAAFEELALDMFARVDKSEGRRRCSDIDATLFDQHRQVSLAYAVLWSMKENLGPANGAFDGLADSWGLDLSFCDNGCSDSTTPWGLARELVDDALDIYSRDGWNADGSLGAEFNKIPYSDWRDIPYEPSRAAFKWKPLLETNKLGFLYRQEHVTPHIGFTAKSFFVGDDKVCSRSLSEPAYKYNKEIELVLQRSAALNDKQKVEIEFFDSKFTSLLPLSVQQFIRQGFSLDSFEFILFDAATIGVVYESVLQSWREKVIRDKIRPTTLIQARKKGETIFAYQGPSEGTVGEMPGEDWQPYIRVMPHAEYPSGSSCVCKAFARAAILFQGDDVTSILGGPLQEVVPAGSSRIETGITPGEDETLEYGSWTEIADRCGMSRLEGGMHFTDSVPDGEVLCEAIGDDLHQYFTDLASGTVPTFTADLAADPVQDRCS